MSKAVTVRCMNCKATHDVVPSKGWWESGGVVRCCLMHGQVWTHKGAPRVDGPFVAVAKWPKTQPCANCHGAGEGCDHCNETGRMTAAQVEDYKRWAKENADLGGF